VVLLRPQVQHPLLRKTRLPLLRQRLLQLPPPHRRRKNPRRVGTDLVGRPIDFSGLVDGYYSFNANHPASQLNQLYNFDVKANQFSLNMAKLSMSHTADPVGFQVDLGSAERLTLFMPANQAPLRASSATLSRRT